jgi:steroid 5-alpha reductase family enzyme
MIEIFLSSALILFVYASCWFLISLFAKRNDVADVAWGMGYALLCLFHAITQPLHPIALVCYVLISTWAIRLSVYIHLRNIGKEEDFRYAQWRKEWGRSFIWRSFLQVYVLQAFLLLIVISPVLLAASAPVSQITGFTVVGVIVWLIGFYWQSVGDYQLTQFKKNRANSEEILDSGLWRYSRHPNYFGEITMWWGLYIIIWPLPNSVFFIIGPLTITFLIRYVSGVPMLERRYKDNELFQAYKQRVPALFPWFPKG